MWYELGWNTQRHNTDWRWRGGEKQSMIFLLTLSFTCCFYFLQNGETTVSLTGKWFWLDGWGPNQPMMDHEGACICRSLQAEQLKDKNVEDSPMGFKRTKMIYKANFQSSLHLYLSVIQPILNWTSHGFWLESGFSRSQSQMDPWSFCFYWYHGPGSWIQHGCHAYWS